MNGYSEAAKYRQAVAVLLALLIIALDRPVDELSIIDDRDRKHLSPTLETAYSTLSSVGATV